MSPLNMNSISVMSLQNIYESGDDSEISELRKQNNKRLEELLQQGRQEMSRRMKNEGDVPTSAKINNSTAETLDREQIIKETKKLEGVTEGFTEIKDPCDNLVKSNKFDGKQNDTRSQIEDYKLQVLPKKSEKFKECFFKNSELFEGTRIPKNKYRKRRQHCDKIVDLTLNFQEKHNNTTTEPLFMSSLLPVTNVWLQKRGVDLFPESQQTRVNVISCTTPTEENMMEMALAASLVTAAKEGSMVPVEAEQANQIHKALSTASTFIPPVSTENENWDSDSAESELASQELDKDNSYCIQENKTAKPYSNVQGVMKNNSINKYNEINNDQVKSLKKTCNTYEVPQSHENIEQAGDVPKKVTIDSKYLGVRITENSEVNCNRKTIATKGKDQNCDNDNWRTNFYSEFINGNRLQNSYNKVIQKSKSDIKLFEKDTMSTVSSSDRLEEQVPGDTLTVKSSRNEDKCLDVTLINQKPLYERERVATMKINFSNTSKQGGSFEIRNNVDPIKDKPSQEPIFKLNNPEIKKINHKTCYFHRSQSTESKLRSSTLPNTQDKPNGFGTGSSKSIKEGVSNVCDKSGADHVNCVNAFADCPIQLNEGNILVDTSSTQEIYLKRNYQERSTSDKLVEPLMQEIAIEQLLRYETVARDFENTVPHHPSEEKSNQCYNQLPTTGPYMKQATGWVPYLNPGMSQQSAVIQAPIPSSSVLMGPQLAFLNPSQYPWHNFVTHPPGVVQQSDCVVKSNPEQTRNLYEPILVPPPCSGTLCSPYFPVPVPQVINSQQTTSKITHFNYQQHRNFVPVVQLEAGTNNSTKNLATENLSALDFDLPPRSNSLNPHSSQGLLQEVSYVQPVPPKAELYYQNLQNMMRVDVKTLNQQMRNLLQLQLQPGNNRLTETSSYGCTTDFGRQRRNTPQLMTTDQQIMTQYQVPSLMCGNSSPLTWQQAAVPFTQLSGQNRSFPALSPTSESTNVQGKGVTPITSLSLAAKGRGRYRNPDL